MPLPNPETSSFVLVLERVDCLTRKKTQGWCHCIKVTFLSGSREQMESSPIILEILYPQWPLASSRQRQHFLPCHKLLSYHLCPSNDRF